MITGGIPWYSRSNSILDYISCHIHVLWLWYVSVVACPCCTVHCCMCANLYVGSMLYIMVSKTKYINCNKTSNCQGIRVFATRNHKYIAWKNDNRLKRIEAVKNKIKKQLVLPARRGLPKTQSMQWALFHWTLPGTNALSHQQTPHTWKLKEHSRIHKSFSFYYEWGVP